MNMNSVRRFLVAILSIAFLASIASPAIAKKLRHKRKAPQKWSRSEKFEVSALVRIFRDDANSAWVATPYGSYFGSLKLQSYRAIGLSGGYNINDYFNLNADLYYGSFDATVLSGRRFDIENDFVGGGFNIDLHTSKKRLTPVISGGLGFLEYVEGDASTDLTYNLGVGLRWDATNHLFIKALYRWTWTNYKGFENSFVLDGGDIRIGYMF